VRKDNISVTLHELISSGLDSTFWIRIDFASSLAPWHQRRIHVLLHACSFESDNIFLPVFRPTSPGLIQYVNASRPKSVLPLQGFIQIDTNQWLDLILKSAIALFAAIIAFNQFKVARDKLRFDLFEKRFSLYNSVYESILSVIRDRPNQIEYSVNVRITREAQFLFGDEVRKYISYLNNKLMKYVLHHNRADSMNKAFSERGFDYQNRDKENDAAESLRTDLTKELDSLAVIFQPYLGMKHRV
jgi:hypothetical protein